MRSFMLILGLVGIFFLGVMLGINAAENNIQKMQALEGVTKSIKIVPKNGNLEISILGNTLKTEKFLAKVDPKALKDKITESKNKLASVSNEVGNGVCTITRGVLERLVLFFQK